MSTSTAEAKRRQAPTPEPEKRIVLVADIVSISENTAIPGSIGLIEFVAKETGIPARFMVTGPLFPGAAAVSKGSAYMVTGRQVDRWFEFASIEPFEG